MRVEIGSRGCMKDRGAGRRTASLPSHSGIVCGGRAQSHSASCLYEHCHVYSVRMTYKRNISAAREANYRSHLLLQSTVTDHRQAHLSHSARQPLQNVLHQRAAVAIIRSVSQMCSCDWFRSSCVIVISPHRWKNKKRRGKKEISQLIKM